MNLVIRTERAVIDGEIRAAAVAVADGVIRAVGPIDADYPATEQIRLPEATVLLPGFVDTHVHINEPGTDWEGFATATAAAAAGGITTLVDMPLDSDPVTTTVDALRCKQQAAQGDCEVDVAFWGGVIPGNLDDLGDLAAAGVRGFKCFLTDSGNPNFPHLNADDFRRAASIIAGLDAVLLVHAESHPVIEDSPPPGGSNYASFLSSRPEASEEDAVALVIDAARETGARVHVAHVSSARVLPALAEAKRAGVHISAETCPHYLIFAAEDIPDGATQFAACPPIRGDDNRRLLWEGLADGTLDMIVSDHSPCAPSMKGDGDFGRVFGGISSLELGLRAVWTHARQRGFGLVDLCRWMAERPAALAVLTDRGRIAVESYLSAVGVMDLVATMLAAGEFDYDAVILAGFGEHGKDALQEMLPVPVLDIAEAAAHVAHLIGRRFSVVTTLARSIPPIEDRLMLAGLDAHCASVRACGLGTAEVDADPARAVQAIVDEAARAVAEDGADVICLGCAGMAGVTASITAKLGVPAVDGVAAALAVAQALVGLRLSTSKAGVYAAGPTNARSHWPLSTALGLDS